jgi:hypothetical protein
MEDLYLRFEKEKSYVQMRLEKEYEGKLRHEKDRFEQKLNIFKQVHGMADNQNLEQVFGTAYGGKYLRFRLVN